MGYGGIRLRWKRVGIRRVTKRKGIDHLESAARPCYSLDAFFSSRSSLDILAISISGCNQGHGSSSMSHGAIVFIRPEFCFVNGRAKVGALSRGWRRLLIP